MISRFEGGAHLEVRYDWRLWGNYENSGIFFSEDEPVVVFKNDECFHQEVAFSSEEKHLWNPLVWMFLRITFYFPGKWQPVLYPNSIPFALFSYSYHTHWLFLFTTASVPALGPTPASYPVGTRGKAAGTWSWPLSSFSYRVPTSYNEDVVLLPMRLGNVWNSVWSSFVWRLPQHCLCLTILSWPLRISKLGVTFDPFNTLKCYMEMNLIYQIKLTYSLTHSMVQDIIWKADCYSPRQKISRFLTEPEGSSPCSQKPATGPYPEPAESSSPHRSLSPQGPS
jgi:hypothetical protein